MRQNDTINILLLVFCILLLGFVYVNSVILDDQDRQREERSLNMEQPIDDKMLETEHEMLEPTIR